MEIYQDIWINGSIQKKGIRPCKDRYIPVRNLCATYKRPITVLDIGANLGYYSFRLCSEFDCIAVMVEGAKAYKKKLLKLIKQQRCRNKLVLLGDTLDLGKIQELSRCEHFDVVLALRVVHHFKEPFDAVIKSIVSLGDNIFFELPTKGEDSVRAKNRIDDELYDHDRILSHFSYKKLGEYPIHVGSTNSPMYLVQNSKNKLTAPFYGSPRKIRHFITSTFDEKKITKNDMENRGELELDWIPGINLNTYNELNGIYPPPTTLAQKIKTYALPADSPLTDIKPWNFVLSGTEVALIDHTSIVDSRQTPFIENPRYCLRNTSLFIGAGIKQAHKVPFNNNLLITKLMLFYRMIPSILRTIARSLRQCMIFLSKIVYILFYF